MVADIANAYEDAAALATERGWGDTPYAIFSCVQRYATENKKTKEKSISERVWFYDKVTLPASSSSSVDTVTGEYMHVCSTDRDCVLECRAALFLLLAAPKDAALWKDMCDEECPMTFPTFCEVVRQVLTTTFKANPSRDGIPAHLVCPANPDLRTIDNIQI